jgi:hypothetical protein
MNRSSTVKVTCGRAMDVVRTRSGVGEAQRLPSFSSPPRSTRSAFSLIEVMVACGIFFMAVFSILALVSGVLRNARGLRRIELDAGMVAAQVSNTNRLTEGAQSGDFGKLYPDYSWEADTYEVATNGLWQIDIVVRRHGLPQPVDAMSIWLFRPESQSGFGRPTFR